MQERIPERSTPELFEAWRAAERAAVAAELAAARAERVAQSAERGAVTAVRMAEDALRTLRVAHARYLRRTELERDGT